MPKVKIDGVQRVEDALTAAEAGADFIGLVFVHNRRRRVSVAQARRVVEAVSAASDNSPKLVGLFADQSLKEVRATIRGSGVDMVQLCGAESMEFCDEALVPVLKVIHVPAGPQSAEQQSELADEVSTGQFRTAGEISDWIEAEYGVSYRLRSVYGMLDRLGCRRRVPRPRHEKTDAAAERTLEKRGLSPALAEAGVTPGTVSGFADEMRVGLRGMVRRVWGRRGVKMVQRVQLAYRWMYLFLVVDGRRGRLSWTWIDSMRSEAIASAVRSLVCQTDVGALVWDGARGHRAEEVEVVERLGLPTVVQPPYSPELNPAERVFEEVRRWVKGRIYWTIEDEMEAVNAYLRELESDPARVRSLAGWNWIVDDIRRLPANLAAASQ